MSPVIEADAYDWYFAALEARADGRELPQPLSTVECGFYRMLGAKSRRWVAVAIYVDEHDGALCATTYADGALRLIEEADAIADLFARCWREVVPESWWRAVVEESAPWPDEPPAAPATNLSADPADEIRYQLLGEKEELERALKEPVASQEQADRLANWKQRLDELGKAAYEAKRKAKAPHEARAKEEEQRWQPLVVLSNELKGEIDRALTAFFNERQRELARQVLESNAPVKATPVKAGTVGRSVAMTTVKTAELVDRKAFAIYLLESQNQDLQECLQRIANKIARAGASAPGIGIVETHKAR